MEQEFQFIIVAGDPLVRAGLAASIEKLPGCYIVSLANPSELIKDIDSFLEEVGANIALWDWSLDSGYSDSFDFQGSEAPIIALLADSSQTKEVLAAGAKALIRRESSSDEIFAAASAVFKGFLVIDPEFAAGIFRSKAYHVDELEELPTFREQQVLQLMAEGLTNKAIAQQLGISHHTVKFHVNSILAKLNAQSRTEAVVQATRLGLLAL